MKITHHKDGNIKTLVDEAPYQPGYEDAIPIPFAGWVKTKANKVEELATCLESEEIKEIHLKESANMLRQQQAEIEHWKELFEKAMQMVEK